MNVPTHITEKAKLLYNHFAGNDPIIHCNRFPSWEELSEQHRDQWIQRAWNPGVTSANQIAG